MEKVFTGKSASKSGLCLYDINIQFCMVNGLLLVIFLSWSMMCSQNHFVKRLELMMLFIVYLAHHIRVQVFIFLYRFVWFFMTFWLFAPSVSNLLGSWQKAVIDFTNPITYARKTSIKEDQSWESWWQEEQVHLKIYICQMLYLAIVLALCFFICQCGIAWHLNMAHFNKNILVSL
ncbi:Callose synthase 12 [Nymphaea thermarum]|nr:Callose synthase 12 [Nymphaea thermarum]